MRQPLKSLRVVVAGLGSMDRSHEDLDLTRHMDDAVKSLAVCLAADESVRIGKAVRL